MRRLFLLPLMLILFTSSHYSQSPETNQVQDETALQKLSLLSDLQLLEARVVKLDNPLARAAAKAEIADATWTLDRDWAKKLLRDAYELSLPDEEEQSKLRSRPVGAPPIIFTATDRARWKVRNRVLMVAGRDKAFADQLVQLGTEHLDRWSEHMQYADLAAGSIEKGDKETASKYILQSIAADPTQINVGRPIIELAEQDRAAADEVILKYIEQLRSVPLSFRNGSVMRVFYLLYRLVFPDKGDPEAHGILVPPPGPAVMRAFVSYMIDSLRELGQEDPESLRAAGGLLSTIWLPLKKYAPDLEAAFLEVERLSRKPGEDPSLSTESLEETYRKKAKERESANSDSDSPDIHQINAALSKGDFDKARKLIDKLADGPQKTQLIEATNAKETISLATKGDLIGAQMLAEKLNRASSILQAYPVIISKCVAKKDEPTATLLVYQAMKQLQHADTTPTMPPPGIPASVMRSDREFDPVLSSLSQLTKSIAPINQGLALEVLDAMVSAANHSSIDTGTGEVGFDLDVFKKLAAKDKGRVRQAAETLQDPFRQIVALATIYRWKAEELTKSAKTNPKKL